MSIPWEPLYGYDEEGPVPEKERMRQENRRESRKTPSD